MQELSWRGADFGREGLLRSDKWFTTLEILAEHEGELITDPHSPVYAALTSVMPEESWLGESDDRSLLRDYQQAWVLFGALRSTRDTGHAIELTEKGREVVTSKNVAEYFRTEIDVFSEVWEIEGEAQTVYPFELIAHALDISCDIEGSVSVDRLEERAEMLASLAVSRTVLLPWKTSRTNKRRFRSYLIVMENAGAIARSRGKVQVLDMQYVKSLVRPGLVAVGASSMAAFVDLDEYGDDVLPEDIEQDLRKRRRAFQYVREGQSAFAKQVKTAYSYACCVTGATEENVLEAAHIMDYKGRQTNYVNNGLCLASDIHAMFDAGRLLINPDTFCVEFPEDMRDARYMPLQGRRINLPQDAKSRPSCEALKRRYRRFSAE